MSHEKIQICCKIVSFLRPLNNFIHLDKNFLCLSVFVHFCLCKAYVIFYKIRIIRSGEKKILKVLQLLSGPTTH